MGNFGTVDLILCGKPFTRLYINQKQGSITGVALSGEDYRQAVSIQSDGAQFYEYIHPAKFGQEGTYRPITPGDHLYGPVAAAQVLHHTAKTSPDGILLENSDLVHALVHQVKAIVNPES